jgi:tetratricopeptide (TPR) repeat protein
MAMSATGNGAISRSGLSEAYRQRERQKSDLILEANLLKQQGLYPQAPNQFAAAADLEEELAADLTTSGHVDKAFIHHFSAISCWTQAGDLHRALQLGEDLLAQETLSPAQRQQVAAYLETLQSRMIQWMSQWTPALVAAD